MRVSNVLVALISAIPCLVQSAALPSDNSPFGLTERSGTVDDRTYTETFAIEDFLEKRHKHGEDWEVLIYEKYNKGNNGDGQCGGRSSRFQGVGNVCSAMSNSIKACANVKLNANAKCGICNFSSKTEAHCGGSKAKSVEVSKGKDINGVELGDRISSVNISCSLE